MKAYVLSEDREHGIKLANIINAAKHAAILSEYSPKSYEEMIDEAEERVNSGYDFGVVVSRNPLEASIHANKNSKLRAVVCRTPADAAKARAARANLVVLDANDFTKTGASSIMHGWLGSAPEIIEEEHQAIGRGISIGGLGKSVLGAFIGEEEAEPEPEKPVIEKPAKAKARRQPVREEEEEAEENEAKPRGGGIMKRLRYTFGIE